MSKLVSKMVIWFEISFPFSIFQFTKLWFRCFVDTVEVKPAPGIIQSNTEPTAPHSSNSDSGTVALIAIAILTTILVIASVVSNRNFIISMNSFHWRHDMSPLRYTLIALFEHGCKRSDFMSDYCFSLLFTVYVVKTAKSASGDSADFKSYHFLYSLFNWFDIKLVLLIVQQRKMIELVDCNANWKALNSMNSLIDEMMRNWCD